MVLNGLKVHFKYKNLKIILIFIFENNYLYLYINKKCQCV